MALCETRATNFLEHFFTSTAEFLSERLARLSIQIQNLRNLRNRWILISCKRMPPRLAGISGKLRGAIFAINEDTMLIGRETAANLCIADASVSRRHSKIEKKDE